MADFLPEEIKLIREAVLFNNSESARCEGEDFIRYTHSGCGDWMEIRGNSEKDIEIRSEGCNLSSASCGFLRHWLENEERESLDSLILSINNHNSAGQWGIFSRLPYDSSRLGCVLFPLESLRTFLEDNK